MLVSNSNPLKLDHLSMRDCSIYVQKKDGRFYPFFWNDVLKRTKKGAIFLVSQHPAEGKIVLMDREAVIALIMEERRINEEREKKTARYAFSRS